MVLHAGAKTMTTRKNGGPRRRTQRVGPDVVEGQAFRLQGLQHGHTRLDAVTISWGGVKAEVIGDDEQDVGASRVRGGSDDVGDLPRGGVLPQAHKRLAANVRHAKGFNTGPQSCYDAFKIVIRP